VCCGHKYVWFRNIEGTEFEIACSECAPGFDEPRGVVSEYVYEPGVQQVVLTGISSFYNNRVSFFTNVQSTVSEDDLYQDYETAVEVSKKEIAHCIEHNMRMSELNTQEARKKASWSAGYHVKSIHEHQRKIDWHRARLNGAKYEMRNGKYVKVKEVER
jgi:hypothetical protein